MPLFMHMDEACRLSRGPFICTVVNQQMTRLGSALLLAALQPRHHTPLATTCPPSRVFLLINKSQSTALGYYTNYTNCPVVESVSANVPHFRGSRFCSAVKCAPPKDSLSCGWPDSRSLPGLSAEGILFFLSVKSLFLFWQISQPC